jgi:hypothetical protein
MQTQQTPRAVESVTAAGNQVLETVKTLIHAGNVRRISIKQDGRTMSLTDRELWIVIHGLGTYPTFFDLFVG